jgi:cytochrome b6-f complex iron-sulfur subunit
MPAEIHQDKMIDDETISKSRREFLKCISGVFAISASPLLLNSCAAGLPTFRGEFDGALVRIPKTAAAALEIPNGVMMVRAPNLPMPIVVRNLPNRGMIALSTICTHKGCEVRVLPDAFQCPCHGSEYSVDGAVVEGPASQPLQRFAVEETPDAIIIKVKS